jgi:two-component system, LytTR family, sensor kinase
MIRKAQHAIPSPTSLVLLTSLAITVFVSLPRLAVWLQLGAMNPAMEVNWLDFSVRAVYLFLTAVLFFAINLQTRRISIGFITINFNKFYQRLLISIILFFVVDVVLIRLHLSLFRPVATLQVFRFLFNTNMAIAVTMTILFAQIFRLVFNNYQISQSNAQLLKANAETKYEVLKNQINPHFLFNSLNTINSLIVTDQQAAVHFVNNMSDVFRYVLKSSDVDMVTVEEELHFLEAYIDMLKGRHGNKLKVTKEVQPAHLYYRLPPMALQILVENAVKHNVVSNSKPLHIHIFSHDDDQLTVTNNWQKRKITEPSTGLGLHNLNQRCKYLSNRDLVIQQTTTQFSVTIPLMPVNKYANIDH